jgi:maltooligosyltrehalose trehalohydrolase
VTAGRASLGANWHDGTTTFEVWAPAARRLDVVVETAAGQLAHDMLATHDGYFRVQLPDAPPGTRYRYRVDGRGPFPDPASRYQPDGVHGPSQVVDPAAFRWSDADWKGATLQHAVIYELHLGTFSREGTFDGLRARLPYLRDLGVTIVELMPIADFPGNRNWGYDGVALFAPARCYGAPDDLRRLVDAAHASGLAVHLDVVYNHFGPDGAYQGVFSPLYISRTHRSAWGDTLNFDGEGSRPVRDYVVENALRWVREYHIDGLRLDATHAIVDESTRHIVSEIVDAVTHAATAEERAAIVVVEDARNLRQVIDPVPNGGWGAHGVWSDDFHHEMRRALAGDSDGYFADFTGSASDIATTARQGWFYTGQRAEYFDAVRGSDPRGLPLERFVFFLQNHDQIGNRALGDRLHHGIDAAVWRAASMLWLMLPETPLLFMGQEWAASTPFRFFTDHNDELGKAVTAGRRQEFSRFAAFSNPECIPDPQAAETFEASRLLWDEQTRDPHRHTLALYRRLLELRRTYPALQQREVSGGAALIKALDEATILVTRGTLQCVARLHGAGQVDLPGTWSLLLDAEDPEFTGDSRPPRLDARAGRLEFQRPGAVVLGAELR